MKKSIIGFSLLAAALAYSTWSWVFQTGLYAYLVRWQAATFDTYFPTLTFAAIFLGLLIPIMLVELAMGVKGERKKGNMEVSLQELEARLTKKSRRYLLTVLVLVACAFAVYYVGQSAPGDDQVAVQIDLSNTDTSDSEQQNYWFKKVALDGVLLRDSSYSITSTNSSRGHTSQTLYTPISAKADKQAPIRFIHLKTSNHNLRINPQLALTGFVRPSVLPVLVRDHFEQNGLVLADRVHVVGDNVVSLQMTLYIVAGLLSLIAFILLFGVLFMPLARKRIIKEWHEFNGET